MRSIRVVLATLAVGFTHVSSAQTAQKIIDDYLRAAGGAKVLRQIQTATLAGSLTEESTGATGSYSLVTKEPNRLYLEMIAGPDRFVEAYNGMSAWGQDAGQGTHTLTGGAARQAEAAALYWNSRLADVKKARLAVQLVGKEKSGGRDVYHVQVSLAAGVTRDVFFDAETHLIAREASPEESLEIDYAGYRMVNGIQTPQRLVVRRGGQQYAIAVTRAEFDSPVENSVFDIPRPAATDLPEIKSLILEVARNQKAIDEMAKEYTCHVTSEEQKTDSKGRVTSTTVSEYESFNLAGDEIRRLVAKDGKPLSGDQKKKEDERFNREYDKRQNEKAKADADPQKQKRAEEKDQAQISDFLRAVRFYNVRREQFRGQEVIAVDFGPNPDFKPKKLIDNIIQKLMGVVWIDEHALDVVRLEGHFSDTAKFAGGVLGSIDKGSSFVFEQARINNEVWLPSYTEIHMGARFLVLKARASEVERYSDYKKFQAESRIVSVKE
jgi:hypothetical protein